jgi:hypothetical protein
MQRWRWVLMGVLLLSSLAVTGQVWSYHSYL